MKYLLTIILVAVTLVGGWFYYQKMQAPDPGTVKLYFYDGGDANGGYKVTTQEVPPSPHLEDVAIRALIDVELDHLFPSIEDDFLGVTIENGVAMVNFKKAQDQLYLTGVPGYTGVVTNSITKTLMQFPTIKKVQFAIDGKVITEWDA